MNSLIKLSLAALFSTATLSSPSVLADSPQPQMEQQQAIEVTDSALKNFVAASQEIEQIRDEYTVKINNVESQEQAQHLQMEAQQKMVEKVENTGISVADYNQIAMQLRTDANLQQRFEELQ